MEKKFGDSDRHARQENANARYRQADEAIPTCVARARPNSAFWQPSRPRRPRLGVRYEPGTRSKRSDGPADPKDEMARPCRAARRGLARSDPDCRWLVPGRAPKEPQRAAWRLVSEPVVAVESRCACGGSAWDVR